jgi:hypothetical protein
MPEVLSRASILILNWIPACAGMTAFGCHFRVNDGENVEPILGFPITEFHIYLWVSFQSVCLTSSATSGFVGV